MQEGQIALLIPIVAITLGLGIPMVKSIVNYKRKKVLIEAFNKERLAAIEKGVTAPPWPDELLRDKGDDPIGPTTSTQLENARHSQLTGGLVTLAVGIAMVFASGSLVGEDVARAGYIPIAVGIALLIAWAVRGRKSAHRPDDRDLPR